MNEAAVKDKLIEASLQKELRKFAYDYLFVVLTTPLKFKLSPKHVTLSKRARWLKTNVVKPSKILLRALSSNNRMMLSEWPPDEMSTRPPNLRVLMDQLSRIHFRANELEGSLSERINLMSQTVEFLADLNNHLYEILNQHFPHITPSRGTYQKNGQNGGMQGRYIELARLIVSEIFPGDRTIANRFFADLTK